MAGLSGLGFLFLLFHFAMMRWVFGVAEKSEKPHDPDLEMIIPIMGVFYLVVGLGMIALITMNILSARYLKQRKKRMFSMITAGFNCLGNIPGIALAVCTFIVLCRDSVKAAYLAEEKSDAQ